MPSSGVTKPLILSNDLEDNYVWEWTTGIMSQYPDFIDGQNMLDLSYALDRTMQNYLHYTLKRLDDHHVSTQNVETLNYKELNDYMTQMGVPFIRNDTSITKKRRLRTWWNLDFGGGTSKTIKNSLYWYIGSGVFYDYDTTAGKADPSVTGRILIASPSSGSLWADGDGAPTTYIDWADYTAGSGAGGTWGDYATVGKADLDIQIYFKKLVDYYKWSSDEKRADVYYLTEKVKPAGLIYSLSHIYDGTLSDSLKQFYEFERDGRDVSGNEDHFETDWASGTFVTSGVVNNAWRHSGIEVWVTDGLNKFASGTIANYSVNLWVKINPIPDDATDDRILLWGDYTHDAVNGHSGTAFYYYKNNNEEHYLTVMTTDGTTTNTEITYALGSGATYWDYSWENIGFSFEGGVSSNNVLIYRSGVAVGSGTSKDTDQCNLNDDVGFQVGYSSSLNGYTIPDGDVFFDELRVWNRVITQTEALELYSGGAQFLT